MKSLFILLLVSTTAIASDDFQLQQDIVLPANTNQLLLPVGEIEVQVNQVSQSHCYIQFNESSSERTLRRGTRLEVVSSARLNHVTQFAARTSQGEQFTFICSKRVEQMQRVLGQFEYRTNRFEDLSIEELAEIPVFVNDDETSKSADDETSQDDSGVSQQ